MKPDLMKPTLHLASWKPVHSIVLIACAAIFTTSRPAIAQIIPDNTLPKNSIVTPGCLDCVINGGTVQGNILFHSFDRFSIGQNGAARFNNDTQLGAIVTRVTGTEASIIDGLVKTNGNTNLFFINPRGITFGPNAQLELGGSFLATTASSVLFPGGGEFSATNPTAPPILDVQVKAPIGVQFEGQPKAIQSNGSNLGLLPTKTLALIGGDITLDGSALTVPDGQVLIGGLAENGVVQISNNSQDFQLSFPTDKRYSNISFFNDTQANVQSTGSGNIIIHSNNLTLAKSNLIAGLNSVPTSISQSGNIEIEAQGELILKEKSHIGNDLNGTVQDQNLVSPNQAGSIYITANNISLSDKSNISSSTRGKGNAGNLIIKSNNQINIDKSYILTTVGLGAVGNGGSIQINAESLNITNNSIFSVGIAGLNEQGTTALPPGNGTAGTLTISATKQVSIDRGAQILGELNPGAIGEGGSVKINTNILSLSNQGKISISTDGYGKAGNLTINAAKQINIDSGAQILGEVHKNAIGQGGSVIINTDVLSLSNQGKISTSTDGDGKAGNLTINAAKQINIDNKSKIIGEVNKNAIGQGGIVTVNTDVLSLSNQGYISTSTNGNGKAGDLTINAAKQVNVDGGAQILGELNTNGIGQGGNVKIKTDVLSLSNGGNISTSTNGHGKAGDLTINAAKQVSLTGQGTYILSGLKKDASVNEEVGGSMTINTELLSLSDKAMISAGTEGEGNAGNLIINAVKELNVNDSYILSTVNNTATGKGGSIVVNTERILLSNQSILSTGSEGKGDAGNLILNSTKDILIDDNTKVNSTLEGGQGKGGEIRVNTGSLTISNQSFLQVTTERADSEAGKINVNANSIYLLNSGAIEAKTQSGNGGDIDLTVKNLILLRNQSRISTTAGTENAGGNGGNLTINAPTGFIIAIPKENSDITANAFSDQGGKITINAKAIFGLVPRSRNDLKILDPQELNPHNVSTSDISAISQQNPTLNGEVILNSALNPNQSLNQVLKEPRTTDVVDSCQISHGTEAVQFYDIGRGGLPPRPEDPLSMDLIEWSPFLTAKARISPPKSLKIDKSRAIDMEESDRTTPTDQASNSPPKLIPPCQSH
jgi:filamentous hemagglutinin family protein